jgi:hypothetical protein
MILGSGILVPFSRYITSSISFHYTTRPIIKRWELQTILANTLRMPVTLKMVFHHIPTSLNRRKSYPPI